MALRAPGGFAINDLRSAAILREYVFNTEPCAPGNVARKGIGPCNPMTECGTPPNDFDDSKNNITIIAATIIVATVLGLVHSFALFIPVVQREYGMGFVEVCFTAALTYAVLIKTSCLACICIQWVGHRLTAMFGMLLVFIGILLDSQVLHFAVFYVAHIVFIGIGGGLAYSAAMCIPGELFRKMLVKGMILVCIGGRLGTIVFYWFSLFLLSHISYKWTKLCIAIIVLLLTAITNLLPSFSVENCGDSVVGYNSSTIQRDREIKDSVERAARKEKTRGPKHPNEKSCLCVCVCDISLWSDWSFLLWGVCVFLSTMALYVPYMYIIAYADSVGVGLSPYYITMLCVASMIGRCVILIGNDFTFGYNRMIFIGGCIRVLWILLQLAETFGWILVWCAAMGLIEGVIVCVIPRLTLVTIPRRWLEHSWGWILWFHALGVFIITVFVAIVGRELLDFYIAFLAIGICQIICGIIAILLPNEESCTVTASVCGSPCGGGLTAPFDYKSRMLNRSGGASMYANIRSTTASKTGNSTNYACNCPICNKVGCIPECPGCVPAGLSSAGMNPKASTTGGTAVATPSTQGNQPGPTSSTAPGPGPTSSTAPGPGPTSSTVPGPTSSTVPGPSTSRSTVKAESSAKRVTYAK